ncbi:hypothetical protein BDV93DRAFT_509541 [Ceratobasidium sp. AG-I]|nr:hypothetical protein BDV93DRAFT_509541 [Ceratobasidium sp. AG-I]
MRDSGVDIHPSTEIPAREMDPNNVISSNRPVSQLMDLAFQTSPGRPENKNPPTPKTQPPTRALASVVLANKLVPAEIMAIILKGVEVKVAKKYPEMPNTLQTSLTLLAIQGTQ